MQDFRACHKAVPSTPSVWPLTVPSGTTAVFKVLCILTGPQGKHHGSWAFGQDKTLVPTVRARRLETNTGKYQGEDERSGHTSHRSESFFIGQRISMHPFDDLFHYWHRKKFLWKQISRKDELSLSALFLRDRTKQEYQSLWQLLYRIQTTQLLEINMNTYKIVLIFCLIPEKILKFNHGIIVLDISLPQKEARSKQKPEQSKWQVLHPTEPDVWQSGSKRPRVVWAWAGLLETVMFKKKLPSLEKTLLYSKIC